MFAARSDHDNRHSQSNNVAVVLIDQIKRLIRQTIWNYLDIKDDVTQNMINMC